jgi:two-component system cell cycle response regulator
LDLSLRARLALVLAGTMIGPLLAAGLVVGVLVPRATDRATDTDLGQAVATTTTVLGEHCLGLGDLATSVADRLTAAGPAVRGDTAAVSAILAPLTATRPGVTLQFVTADRTVAGAGPLASSWDPAASVGASCSRRTTGGASRPQLVESVDLPVVVGLQPSRVVAVEPLDGEALAALRDSLRLGGVRLALLPVDGGPAVAVTGVPAGGQVSDAALRAALGRASTGLPAGESGGWRFRQRTAPAGVPYSIVALSRPEGSGLQRTLLVVLMLATIVLLMTLSVITSRLTGPLAELTAVARRLGGGDLRARTGIRGTDEVGTLAAAFDAMADELESTVEELCSSQGALSHTFARFGEALGATHDLDGLLRTVVEAAMRGSEATIGTAYLGDAKDLEQRVTAPSGLFSGSSEQDGQARSVGSAGEAQPGAGNDAGTGLSMDALAGLADLADDAVCRGELVVTDLVDVAGPALAVPLRRDERVIGALAVARDAGSAPFDPLALEAVTALAAHAGTAVANVRAHEETSKQSVTDPLTGAGNLRHLTTTLAKEVERASRFNRPLSLLMLDLDNFKQVNDTAGHAFGDAVLREFARRITGCLRDVDVVARYGGEEFVVVLPETAAEGACAVATRIVEAVRSELFQAGGKSRTVTVSVGVSAFPDHGRNASELTRSADAALYTAKHNGRDRWVLAGGTRGGGVAVAQTG